MHFQNWEEVAQPANRHAPWFEHVLIPFTCKLIHDAEAGRLQAFHDNDPRHAVTPRLLRSLTDPRMSYDLTYLNLGDAAGVTFYCGGGFDMDDPHRTGARVETIGISHEHALRFGVRMTPPSSGRTGLAESSYHVRLPVDGPMEFRCSVRGENGYDGECRIELVDDATRPDMPGTILERLTAGDAFTPVTVDLSAHAGRRVWLRLVSDGGREVRSPATQPNQTAPKAYWLEPRVEAAGRVACDLIEFYKEARAGYRLYDDAGQPGPLVFLGLRGSMYQVWYADQVMSLVANRARLAGKRAVANEFHPGSGSPHAMFPLAIYDSMIRLMQFRCPSVAYFCHMYQGEFASYSMANSQEHVARARNQAMLWQAYANVPQRRRSKVACFMPSNFATPQQASEAADRFGTRSALIGALGELGADVYLLNDLDQAADYDKLVIFLAYADREAEAKLHALLKSDLTGKRVIVLTSVSKLWGPVGRRVSQRIDADLAEVLPVIPVGERMVQKTAEVMPGLRATLHLADTVRVQALPGFTNLHADDGTVIGARSENLLVLAGYPDTPANEKLSRGWFDTSMRRLIHGWLNVEPGLIDMGSIRMVSRDFRADSPAIYSVENSSLLELGRGLAAYDVLHQYPVTARAAGPAVIRAWRVDEPKLVDSDLCEPVRVLEQVEHIAVTLVAPAFLKASRPQQLTFYWPQAKPDVRMDGQAVGTEDLGAGFYCIAAPSPGVHCLEITGAGSTRPSAD